VIKTVGADHVAIGLDMVGGRSSVPRSARGYGEIVAALNKITTPENVRKITGENWLRVLEQARAV
jgi:membrane dipeptidase